MATIFLVATLGERPQLTHATANASALFDGFLVMDTGDGFGGHPGKVGCQGSLRDFWVKSIQASLAFKFIDY